MFFGHDYNGAGMGGEWQTQFEAKKKTQRNSKEGLDWNSKHDKINQYASFKEVGPNYVSRFRIGALVPLCVGVVVGFWGMLA